MVDFGYGVFQGVARPSEPFLEYVVVGLVVLTIVVFAYLKIREMKNHEREKEEGMTKGVGEESLTEGDGSEKS